MNIGFDAKRAYFNDTGLGNYSRTLIKNLSKNFPEHNYFLYTPKKKSNSRLNFILQQKNIFTCIPPNLIIPSNFWRSFGIKNDLKKDNINLFHGLSNELPYSIKKTKIKSIVTIHDLIFLRFPDFYNSIDRKFYEWKFKYSCREADKIISISEQTKHDIIHYYGIDDKKIEVIYQSCDPIFYSEKPFQERNSIKSKYGLPDEFILYIGSIIERKNLLSLVKALKKTNQGIPLVVIGKGKSYFQKVLSFIKENKIEKQILFPKNVIFDDFPAIYQQAKILVYPSFFEGFGIPIIEGLWSKTPVITSQGSCFSEAGGPSSVYIQPNNIDELSDAIINVMSDHVLREKMKKDGFNYVQRFHEEKVTKEVMNLYQQLS